MHTRQCLETALQQWLSIIFSKLPLCNDCNIAPPGWLLLQTEPIGFEGLPNSVIYEGLVHDIVSIFYLCNASPQCLETPPQQWLALLPYQSPLCHDCLATLAAKWANRFQGFTSIVWCITGWYMAIEATMICAKHPRNVWKHLHSNVWLFLPPNSPFVMIVLPLWLQNEPMNSKGLPP